MNHAGRESPDFIQIAKTAMRSNRPAAIADVTKQLLGYEYSQAENNRAKVEDNARLLMSFAEFLTKHEKKFASLAADAAYRAHDILADKDRESAAKSLEVWEKAYHNLPDDMSKMRHILDNAPLIPELDECTQYTKVRESMIRKWQAIPYSAVKQDLLANTKAEGIERLLEQQMPETPKARERKAFDFLKEFDEWSRRFDIQKRQR